MVLQDLTGLQVPLDDIARLTALRELSLAGNHLAGELSESLCTMTSLRSLALQQNSFGGVVPPCLTNLTDVRLLWCVHPINSTFDVDQFSL